MFFNYLSDTIKLQRLRSRNSYIRPRFINFILTYRCNARCIMCNIWDVYNQQPDTAREELSAQDIEKFLADNREELSDLRNFGLSGGDPLLMRHDFVNIVKIIKTALPGVHLGVQTNGLIPELAKERLGQVLSFYPDFSLAVSIDGIGEVHDKVRGVAGAFQKATQTIKYAQGLGINNITAGMTLNRHNYAQIKEVKDYVESLGVEFSCFPVEVTDYFNNQEAGDFQLGRQEEAKVIEQLKSCCGYHYYMDNLRLQLEGKRVRSLPCFSGFTSLVIDPYGNVKPCVLKVRGIENDVFGNIKKSRLKEMLDCQNARRIRERIKKCSCWCQCEVSSSAVVCPFDILKWFILRCPDKKAFIGRFLAKKDKYATLL